MRTTNAHQRSLISAFVFRCLDGIICILAVSKISRAGWFESYLVGNPEDRFSCDEAVLHVSSYLLTYTITIYPHIYMVPTSPTCLRGRVKQAELTRPSVSAAGVVQCGGRKTSPHTSTIVQFIFYFGPLRSA